MIAIVSDPSVYPLREVALTDSADGVLVRPIPSTKNVNVEFARPGGGRNVMLFAPQNQLEIAVRDFTDAQHRALLELQGLQLRSRQRTGIYILPNFDGYTRLSAPLSRSVKAWLHDKATDTLLKSDPSTITRAATGYYHDERGNIASAASDVPRFGPSCLGHGYMPGSGYVNLATPYHPSSGNVMWTAILGSPTIAWVTQEISPVLSKGGCVKITKTSAGIAVVRVSATVSSSIAGNHVWGSVWLKGVGRVQLVLSIGTNTVTTANFTLSRRWVRYDVGPLPKTDASTTATLDISIQDDGYARTIFGGPVALWQQTDANKRVPQEWHDAASNAADVLRYSVPLQTGELTFSCCGLLPPAQTLGTLWSNMDAPTYQMLEFTAAGMSFWTGDAAYPNGVVFLPINAVYWDSVKGYPYHVTARLQPGSADLQLAVRHPDGTIVRYPASASGLNVSDYSMSLRQAIGTSGTAQLNAASIQHARLDIRRWSDAQRQLHEEMYLDDRWRDVILATAGRLFELKTVEVAHPYPNRPEYDGRIVLEEIRTDPDLAISA